MIGTGLLGWTKSYYFHSKPLRIFIVSVFVFFVFATGQRYFGKVYAYYARLLATILYHI